MLKTSKAFIMVLLFISLFIVGCEQEGTRVKGVRKRNKLEGEPELIVELVDGQEKNLGLEEYITGVVAGEMKADWPENAYAAQAIIARTFALKHMSDNNTNRISGSYQFAQEYKPENISSEIEEAVQKTRGEVVVYNDDYINAWFHSSAAGQTTSAKVGLAYEKNEPPYVVSVDSPDDQAPDDVQNWEAVFSNSEITNTLAEMGNNIVSLNNIEIVDKDDTGRVIHFKFTGESGDITIKAANFRNELDSKRLKSIKISKFEMTDDGVVFAGSGFGHGVGMSQWGAYAMAKEGSTPEEIVSHYFKDVEIVKEYD